MPTRFYRKSAELRARQICAFNSHLTSPNCTSTWTGRKRVRSDSRNTTLRKICWYHSVAVFRPLLHFFSIPRSRVSYSIATQTPQYRIQTLQDLENIPVTGMNPAAPPEILGSLASVTRQVRMSVISHYDIRPVIDIYGSVQGRDLGAVARQINRIITDTQGSLPRGSQVIVRGQVRTMRSSYIGLLAGLAFSIVLVYLLIVVNFQSWLDPFIIISALPAALAGIAWFLFVSRTTVSVPALTGTIMCMGVATANSILVVSFATEQMQEGKDAIAAALEAGYTRFRPVLMTALGNDYRHGTDGAGTGRRRRAERTPGARCDWRPVVCHGGNTSVCTYTVQFAAWFGAR